jgi:deazaflavin-dependent oxidoreductase (nitroreductase family)
MPPLMRRIFWFLNKFFMVPMMRLGFGPLFGNPFTGYIMVLKTIGRKSGKLRFTPVNYAVYKGDVYCISGGRQSSDWYRNVRATPEIEVMLPGGTIYGFVDEDVSPDARRVVVREVLKNAGFAGFFEGYNPFTITDEELMQKSADLPVLRIHPIGLGSGASDSGGWAWLWVFLATIALILVLLFK